MDGKVPQNKVSGVKGKLDKSQTPNYSMDFRDKSSETGEGSGFDIGESYDVKPRRPEKKPRYLSESGQISGQENNCEGLLPGTHSSRNILDSDGKPYEVEEHLERRPLSYEDLSPKSTREIPKYDFKVFCPGTQEITESDVVDLIVNINGREVTGTVYTIKALGGIFAKNVNTGECAEGSYFPMQGNFLILRDFKDSTIRRTLDDLMKNGEFNDFFD